MFNLYFHKIYTSKTGVSNKKFLLFLKNTCRLQGYFSIRHETKKRLSRFQIRPPLVRTHPPAPLQKPGVHIFSTRFPCHPALWINARQLRDRFWGNCVSCFCQKSFVVGNMHSSVYSDFDFLAYTKSLYTDIHPYVPHTSRNPCPDFRNFLPARNLPAKLPLPIRGNSIFSSLRPLPASEDNTCIS